MTRTLGWAMLAAVLWTIPAAAEPIFNVIPSDNHASAAPGETVGWGYEIVNDDPDHWLVISNLVLDPFTHGTGSDAIFDFPVLAPAFLPGSSLIQPYVPGQQGLYEFTWALTAPDGFVNSGVFLIGAELWDGDPFAGGQFASTLPDFTAAYSVAVPSAPTQVPEPGTLLLLSTGLGLVGLSQRVRRNK